MTPFESKLPLFEYRTWVKTENRNKLLIFCKLTTVLIEVVN